MLSTGLIVMPKIETQWSLAPQSLDGPKTPDSSHLVHSWHDPAIFLAEGTDLSHFPGGIVGQAKLHELALQGRDSIRAQLSPGDQEGGTDREGSLE